MPAAAYAIAGMTFSQDGHDTRRMSSQLQSGPKRAQAELADAGRAVLVELLRGVAAHDPHALERLYGLTSAKINGVIHRIMGDTAIAEEVLQDVYVNVWRKAGSFNPAFGSPITWLASIARNKAIDRLRSERSRNFATDSIDDVELADESVPVIERLIATQDGTRLMGCLALIDQDQQRAIRAAFFEGLTYDELARREGVPLSTMKSRIRRGLMKLRTCLDR